MPVGVTETDISVAVSDPSDMNSQMDVESLTGRRAAILFALPYAVESCMEQIFSSDELVYDLLTKVETQDEIIVPGEEKAQVREDLAVTSPIIALVNSIISQAYRRRSSDIHIEHEEKSSHVRIRIDGILKNIMMLPRHIATGPLVSRIKIMAELDVSNHMRPQDGRTKLRISGTEVGLRVSVLPTAYGEKVVMRILDQRAAEVPFEELGFAPEVAAGIDKCLNSNQGIMLVTGPTGSGKTTTLYSMLHTVSHEFNNNLTVFSTGLFLLKEMEAEPVDEARVRILTMLESTQAQLGLYVKNILNEARTEDGRFKLIAKPLALRELVAESAATVQGILKQKEINLSVKMPEAPVFINADREALALVVSNLLGNAIKYTPQKGSIEIEICVSGEPAEKILFSVEDSGVGIPLADLKKITAGFYRTEESKAVADGFGLGLRIVNELLALHGSHLEIASEKGKGSRFFFELPAMPSPPPEKPL